MSKSELKHVEKLGLEISVDGEHLLNPLLTRPNQWVDAYELEVKLEQLQAECDLYRGALGMVDYVGIAEPYDKIVREALEAGDKIRVHPEPSNEDDASPF